MKKYYVTEHYLGSPLSEEYPDDHFVEISTDYIHEDDGLCPQRTRLHGEFNLLRDAREYVQWQFGKTRKTDKRFNHWGNPRTRRVGEHKRLNREETEAWAEVTERKNSVRIAPDDSDYIIFEWIEWLTEYAAEEGYDVSEHIYDVLFSYIDSLRNKYEGNPWSRYVGWANKKEEAVKKRAELLSRFAKGGLK